MSGRPRAAAAGPLACSLLVVFAMSSAGHAKPASWSSPGSSQTVKRPGRAKAGPGPGRKRVPVKPRGSASGLPRSKARSLGAIPLGQVITGPGEPGLMSPGEVLLRVARGLSLDAPPPRDLAAGNRRAPSALRSDLLDLLRPVSAASEQAARSLARKLRDTFASDDGPAEGGRLSPDNPSSPDPGVP
jgi:hypothetical protein